MREIPIRVPLQQCRHYDMLQSCAPSCALRKKRPASISALDVYKPADGTTKTQHTKSKKKTVKRADSAAVKQVLVENGFRKKPGARLTTDQGNGRSLR